MALLLNALLLSMLSVMDFFFCLSHYQTWNPFSDAQNFASNSVPKSEMPAGNLSGLSCSHAFAIRSLCFFPTRKIKYLE